MTLSSARDHPIAAQGIYPIAQIGHGHRWWRHPFLMPAVVMHEDQILPRLADWLAGPEGQPRSAPADRPELEAAQEDVQAANLEPGRPGKRSLTAMPACVSTGH